jgi:hypothetical protein
VRGFKKEQSRAELGLASSFAKVDHSYVLPKTFFGHFYSNL